jgi:hypothetical protein
MPATQIRTNRKTRKKYPLGTEGHYENIKERRAEHSIDVQMNRGIQELKRARMGLAADQPMYQIGIHVATIGGTAGKIIGSSQYITGWEYRIQPDNGKRTIYREEWQIHPNPGLFDAGKEGSPVIPQKDKSVYSKPQERERLGAGYGGKSLL